MNQYPPEPSPDACDNHEQAQWNGQATIALWYPQMGGYAGKAVAVRENGPDGCLEVYVWHDGEFPFTEADRPWAGARSPARLHHCDPDQFVGFGQTLARWQPS